MIGAGLERFASSGVFPLAALSFPKEFAVRSTRKIQRRPVRHTVEGHCQVVRENGFTLVADRIENLSTWGMLVGPADPVLTGERVFVSFRIPGTDEWNLLIDDCPVGWIEVLRQECVLLDEEMSSIRIVACSRSNMRMAGPSATSVDE